MMKDSIFSERVSPTVRCLGTKHSCVNTQKPNPIVNLTSSKRLFLGEGFFWCWALMIKIALSNGKQYRMQFHLQVSISMHTDT